ncbi:T9SS type A sorting domain-containing protein, partial [candidate division WOR-3 bacterium]|nr:T9SS type A sorting domain-containing protein [candidate division WOR-3 bacterium]
STERNSNVSVSVYNVTGRKVKKLFNGTIEKGNRIVVWDGTNEHGRRLPQGIYFVRMEIPEIGFIKNTKVVLIR